ncbi:vWA domain-containing protein [Mariniblastus fucicola]|uniref:VWFA domain-containing protein n=1 Tax=Mariniblastus fucicola TaxID=980251 RepID=A0A5B9PBQ3_9BACT|nr:VWA domain-containing protein [Mariniblastus fucicola]QEG22470.1 hypothetical protein MFFC18_23500 [Mariniblastus fucicola]
MDSMQLLSVVWRPIFVTGWIWVLVALAVALSVFAYARVFDKFRYKSLLLMLNRLFSILLVSIILFGPSKLLETESVDRKGVLHILTDVSESMTTKESSGKTRLEHVHEDWLTRSALREMAENFDVHLYQFAEKPRLLGSTGDSGSIQIAKNEDTFLIRSATEVLNGRMASGSNQAMLILSDGIDSEEASVDQLGKFAQAKGVAVHTVAFGSDAISRDMAIVAAAKQQYLYPNELGSIVAKIYQVGLGSNRTMLKVQQGEETKTVPIDFKGRGVVQVEIPVQQEKAGQYEYKLSLNAITGEIELANNVHSSFVRVQPRRMQVLLLEGAPFWDTKFIAQSLRQDERIELTQVSQVNRRKRLTIVTRGEEEQTQPVSVPETLDDWARYDVVVFGRQIENLISPESAKELVELYETSGINIVCSRGRPYGSDGPGESIGAALMKIEPVAWSGEKFPKCEIELTMFGQMTRWFAPTKMGLDVETAVRRLSGFTSGDIVESVKPNARILAETVAGPNVAAAQPALLTSSGGAGSFVTVAGEGFWKWSLLSSEDQDLVGFYDAFWSNMIRWLVVGGDFQPGEKASMKLSKSSLRVGEELTVDVALKQAAATVDPQIFVTLPDGQTKPIALTPVAGRNPRFRAKVLADQGGIYEIRLNAPGLLEKDLSQKFSAYQINVEKLNTTANPMTLKMIAGQCGGEFYQPSECEKFLKQVKLDAEAAKIPPKTVYIWDRAWLMLLLSLSIGSEWIFRRYAGLI